MDERTLRRKLRERGIENDELERRIDDWASDEYDRQKDYEIEDNQRKERNEND